jgi:hypothetical protein
MTGHLIDVFPYPMSKGRNFKKNHRQISYNLKKNTCIKFTFNKEQKIK